MAETVLMSYSTPKTAAMYTIHDVLVPQMRYDARGTHEDVFVADDLFEKADDSESR
jgi:hypothetical protein